MTQPYVMFDDLAEISEPMKAAVDDASIAIFCEKLKPRVAVYRLAKSDPVWVETPRRTLFSWWVFPSAALIAAGLLVAEIIEAMVR